MTMDPGLRIGEEIDNRRLRDIFKCGPQGGMRRSIRSGSLVLTSSHVDSIYNDRWVGKTLHYTGMGLAGDQSLYFMQNKTLAESNTNGVDVHLFEVNRSKIYTYVGRVRLESKPYQEDQPDKNAKIRKVWIFPLQLVTGDVPAIPSAIFEKEEAKAQGKARRLTDEQIQLRASKARPRAGQRQVTATRYERDSYVSEHAKRRANGVCELCQGAAPFRGKDGDPYLETHHIKWLARDGEDAINNTVALCPNCHRRMHVLDLKKDRSILLLAVAGHHMLK